MIEALQNSHLQNCNFLLIVIIHFVKFLLK